MATVYPTSAGAWSTRTWNDDSTGAAYGPGTPQAGDTVKANNLAITLDTDITVVALSTRVGTTAAAGGSFTTSGTRTITADSYAGTSNCFVLSFNSGSVQNGNSYGSNTTNSTYGTTVNNCIQNGNSTGGNGSNRIGTNIGQGGIQNGNSTGGSANGAWGTSVGSLGIQNGNSTGGSGGTSYGSRILGGGIQNGNSTGGSADQAYGTSIATGGIQNGNSTGGSVNGAWGTYVTAGCIQFGNATGGSAAGAHGTYIDGGAALITTAAGATSGAFGVYSPATSRYVVIIQNESGSYPKSLTGSAETTSVNVPFVSFEGGGGGGASESVSFYAV